MAMIIKTIMIRGVALWLVYLNQREGPLRVEYPLMEMEL